MCKLLNGHQRWARGMTAQDARGQPVDYFHPTAVRFCLLGAAARCYIRGTPNYRGALAKLARIIRRVMPRASLYPYTDADVVLVFNDHFAVSFTDVSIVLNEAGV